MSEGVENNFTGPLFEDPPAQGPSLPLLRVLPPYLTVTYSFTCLAVELCDQVHTMCDEEARQVPHVQTSVLVHREVGPTFVKLDTSKVSRRYGPDPNPVLSPNPPS